MPITTEQEMLKFLTMQSISYHRFEHLPVFTCEQADLYRPRIQAVSTKNLFLTDKHHTHYLVMTDCDRKLDLKELGHLLQASKLHFSSEGSLLEILGLTPGAVTVLALINDTDHRVQLWIDSQIWQYANFLCHPMVNTATLVLTKGDLERFLEHTGHEIHLF